MVLDSQRSRADRFLIPMTNLFIKWKPDRVSLLSLTLAAFAGIFIYLGASYRLLLLAAFLCVVFSSLFDAIDGKLARVRNISSPRGDLIDHVFDRFADVFMILGFIFGMYAQYAIGILALVGVMLTSYMGVQSQALGLKRNYSGILGRADRLVLIMIFILVEFIIPFSVHLWIFRITPVAILLIWFAIAGNATAVKRFLDSYRALAPS